MATLLSLKRRIQAAQNVSKTTKAMQMIAASKMKRAQDSALSTRPYVEKLTDLTINALSNKPEGFSHPYLKENASGKELVLVLSPDKGLCGGLITNLLKEFLSYQKQNPETAYILVGKKAEIQVTKLGKEVVANFNFGTSQPSYDMVYPLIKLIDDYYLSGKVDSVKVLYTKFNNVFTQHPVITQILPLSFSTELSKEEQENPREYIYEPNVATLLPQLLAQYMEMSLYQFLLESFVSEQGARMLAMQNATTNANDIISELRLEYNKTRQAKITSEILDITGASLALQA